MIEKLCLQLPFLPHCFIQIRASESGEGIMKLRYEFAAVVFRHTHKRSTHDDEFHLEGKCQPRFSGKIKPQSQLCPRYALDFLVVPPVPWFAHTGHIELE
jgi:hypothetical protein